MSPITTHVLDLARGKPASGIAIRLEESGSSGWKEIGAGDTDSDGRLKGLLPVGFQLKKGLYRIRFETLPYFKNLGSKSFYPHVEITFEIEDTTSHYHVPLLISPYGYSTYRGS